MIWIRIYNTGSFFDLQMPFHLLIFLPHVSTTHLATHSPTLVNPSTCSYPYIHRFIHISIKPSIFYPSIYPSTFSSIYLYILYPFIHWYTFTFNYWFINLPTHLHTDSSIYLYTHLLIHLSTHIFIHPVNPSIQSSFSRQSISFSLSVNKGMIFS